MAKLTLPDGRVLNFPDGLQPAQVKSIVDAASAPQGMPAPVANGIAAGGMPQAPGKVRLQIGERIVEVDDSFMKMSPQDQQSTVDEIETSISTTTPQPRKPIFNIETPSGRKLKIEADDQAAALRGAEEWETQNAASWNPASPKSDFQGQIPERDLRSATERAGHKAKLAAQSVGQGVVGDLLGLPADFKALLEWSADGALDLARRGVNATAVPMINKGLEMAEVPVQVPSIPEMTPRDEMRAKINQGAIDEFTSWGVNPDLAESVVTAKVPGGDEIGERFSDLAQWAGYEPAKPETSGERLGYNVGRFTSGALTGAGLLRSGAKAAIESGKAIGEVPALARPYVNNATRTMVGDAAGGAGAASGLHVVDEHMPESVADNPLARLLAMVGGGVAGSNASALVRSPAKVAETAFSYTRDTNPALVDPVTGESPRRRNVDQAAQFVQSNATDPAAAKTSIERNQAFFKDAGGAMPTSGLMSDDLGLQMLEKSYRNAEPKPFLERDKALRNSAAEDLVAARPADGDPFEARGEARTQVSDKRQAADLRLKGAERDADAANAAERALLENYAPMASGQHVASEDLDKVLVDSVLKPYQNKKNALFEGIDPDGTVTRDITSISSLAAEMKNAAKDLPTAVRRQILPEGLIDDLVKKGTDDPQMSFKDMNTMRSAISSMESQAQLAGQFPVVERLKGIKSAIADDAKALAAEGSDAGNRALDAFKFYEEAFAPLFARGEGGKFRKDFNRDDGFRTNTPPTATAQRFLRDGSGSKEAAESLNRILAASPNPAAGADAARRYVLSDMVKAVGADGKVSETALRRWINSREGMLSQLPEMRKQVTGLLDEVVSRSRTTGRLRSEVETAAASKQRSQREIDKSALSLLIDADPKRAAESVLGSRDPVGAATELKKAFAGNLPAERGWRAAVADYLIESLGSSGKAGVADDLDAVSLEKINSLFRKNEAAIRTIFGEDARYLNQARRRLEALSNKNVQSARNADDSLQPIWQQLLKPLDVVLRLSFGALEGGSRSKKAKVLAEQLPDTTKAAHDLMKRAMLDPEVAKHLLSRTPKQSEFVAWNKRLNRLMGWAEVGRTLNREDERADR